VAAIAMEQLESIGLVFNRIIEKALKLEIKTIDGCWVKIDNYFYGRAFCKNHVLPSRDI
jgi:hypothetical protein